MVVPGRRGHVEPTHRALPRWGASGGLHRTLPDGWGVFLGGGHQRYESTHVNRQHLGVERYIGPARLAYRIGLHQVDADRSGVDHQVSGSWFYGCGSSATLALGAGRQAIVVGVGDVRSVGSRSAALRGTHWLDARTGVTYSLVVHRHGDLFTRTGASLGVRRRL